MATSEKNSIVSGVAAGTVGLAGAIASKARAQGSGKIKIGLLGCGGRGNGALRQCLNADPGVEVIAMADLFEDKVRKSRDRIMRDEKFKGRVKIDDDHLFWGFDCHEKLVKCDADLLL
ncbi:MAG: gfo/Idh/MocA family oxidoreductase, partial [Planctomycetes bacterium]|nr:gfo/Idh/MocA family oxidoreductase [Planctomycetota bacterium]